jgi:DNA (cytosine-5)-methyltransferase 1
MRIGSLFSGIGGLELGLEWSGIGETVWQVEQNEYYNKVLAKHWPDVRRYGDAKTVGKHNLEPVDLICGGFPCQDVSAAGAGAGLSGARSGLWYEFLRVVKELRPSWVVVENVASGAIRWVDTVRLGLARESYASIPIPLSAQDCGAWHLRRRIFIVAHLAGCRQSRPLPQRLQTGEGDAADRTKWPCPPDVGGVVHGVPDRVDRIHALGNAVVPQCAQVIGEFIEQLMGVSDG